MYAFCLVEISHSSSDSILRRGCRTEEHLEERPVMSPTSTTSYSGRRVLAASCSTEETRPRRTSSRACYTSTIATTVSSNRREPLRVCRYHDTSNCQTYLTATMGSVSHWHKTCMVVYLLPTKPNRSISNNSAKFFVPLFLRFCPSLNCHRCSVGCQHESRRHIRISSS